MPELTKLRNQSYRERGKDLQGTIYVFPDLDECRNAFEKSLNQKVEWDGPDEWLERANDDGHGPGEPDCPF